MSLHAAYCLRAPITRRCSFSKDVCRCAITHDSLPLYVQSGCNTFCLVGGVAFGLAEFCERIERQACLHRCKHKCWCPAIRC